MVPSLPTEKISASQLRVVHLPPNVCFSVFERCVDIAERLRTYEGKPTGCILVLADEELVCRPLSNFASKLVHKSIIDDRLEGSLREAFSADGGMLIDGRSGEILATKVRFPTPRGPCFVLEGTGSRHSEGFEVACVASCVAITRSQDGYVTIFSSEHLQCSPDEAMCFRVQDERRQGQLEVVMERTPLVRFAVNGKMEVPKQAFDALSSLEAPLQVVAFVGPGRTGKSTLAGKVAGKSSLFPAARALGAVTDGIDAVAIHNPGTEGTLLLLDCEGFDNAFAKSRPEVATLCLLLCSQIVCVDYDRLGDNMMANLARLSACRQVLMPSGAVSADKLDPQPPELVVVVNGSRFHDKYDSGTLERALSSDEGNAERNGCREAVRKHFPCRHFVSVPVSTAADFEIGTLRDIVLQAPLLLTAGIGLLGEYVPANRQDFDGTMFRDLLSRSVVDVNGGGCIQPRNVYQSVLQDSDARWIEAARCYYESHLPVEGPYRHGLKYQPDQAMQHADVSRMTAEGVKRLEEALRYHHDKVERENEKKGQATIQQGKERKEFPSGQPSYQKVNKQEKMLFGGAVGALGATGAGCAVVATGGLVLFAALPAMAFGGAKAGYAIARGVTETKYKRIQRYDLKERTVTEKANGEVVRGEWRDVGEQRHEETLVDEGDVPQQFRQ